MNCRPGDLAVIVHDEFTENIGRFVRVIAAGQHWPFDDRPHWFCEVDGQKARILCTDDDDQPTGMTGWSSLIEQPDADLRPIRDPGDDATDETLLRLPAPKQTEAA